MSRSLYVRKIRQFGFGMMVLRDFSFEVETPLIDDDTAFAAQRLAWHADASRVFLNESYTGSNNDFKYAIGHRGIDMPAGYKVIAEFEFVSLN